MGRREKLIAAITAVVALLGVACGGGSADDTTKTTFTAHLTGDQVAPGPGDDDGTADVTITTGEEPGTICYAYSTSFVDQPTSVVIGTGGVGDFGATVVTLASGPQGSPGGCVQGVDEAIIRGIKLMPQTYYVQIDNAAFPEGAVRGQL